LISLFDIPAWNLYGTPVQKIPALFLIALFLTGVQSRGVDSLPARPGRTNGRPLYLSPTAVVATADGKQLFVACATAKRVLVLDAATQRVTKTISVADAPLGLTLSPDGRRLFVACAAPQSIICVVDTISLKVSGKIRNGHTAMAPVCSPDGKFLYVCNRFDDSVAVIDLAARNEVGRIPVPREPVAATLTPDGKFLFVANHLHTGRADADEVAACVSVIDTGARRVIRNIALPNGSTIVRDIRVSPAGDYACVAHVIGQFHLPTTQIERGWIDNNALSFIDVRRQTLFNTVLLDNIDNGAANPWGVAWTADAQHICVTHAGTHELSIIAAPALLKKLQDLAPAVAPAPGQSSGSAVTPPTAPPVPPVNDLTFLVGLRQRVRLDQKGPRSLAIVGNKVYVANYFSDSLSVVDVSAPTAAPRAIALGPAQPLSIIREGELAFNDASFCFQGWQSCASCHSSDARVDGLNWDLLNDGIGNPKNAKSLLNAHKTPPSMALGIRANARLAVRAGFRYILFTVPPEETALAVDAYLESLKPIPSPYLERGKLSQAAARGRKLFRDPTVGCATCHPARLYTDLKAYDVGTNGKFDKPTDRFFTPPLVEVWRTAPYLHDGSAATMRDVLTTANSHDRHGKTSHLTSQQIEDLAAFLLSL
jgi:YVTN family beta-propeller protein